MCLLMRFYHDLNFEVFERMTMFQFYVLVKNMPEIIKIENPQDEKDKPQPLTSKHFAQFVKDKKAKR